MTAEEYILERMKQGVCPICGEWLKENSVTYKHPKYGDMKICYCHRKIVKEEEQK